jgi:predicted nucleic acid-binding protein
MQARKGIPQFTISYNERALHIAERYGYSIFDSLIIAAALHVGADTLYSEDMRDGQAINGLTIRNPFFALDIRAILGENAAKLLKIKT